MPKHARLLATLTVVVGVSLLTACGSSKPKPGTAASLGTSATPAGSASLVPGAGSPQATGGKAKSSSKDGKKAAVTAKSGAPAPSSSKNGSSKKSSSAAGKGKPTSSQASVHSSPAKPKAKNGGGSPVPSVPPIAALPTPTVSGSAVDMLATLHGESHGPTANRLWRYSVEATDPSGHPLSGTVLTEFVYDGRVVGKESPPTHPLTKGRLDDSVTYPTKAIGYSLTFQVVVTTSHGSVTLDWPVKVVR